MPGHQSNMIGLELAGTFMVGALAVGCFASWLREWRHDDRGRVFFTLLTALAVLLALGLSADTLHRLIGS